MSDCAIIFPVICSLLDFQIPAKYLTNLSGGKFLYEAFSDQEIWAEKLLLTYGENVTENSIKCRIHFLGINSIVAL